MPKRSAGILLYRTSRGRLEVLLVHPGGPFWQNKDNGSWSIPKGEYQPNQDPLTAARREVAEETGLVLDGDFIQLTPRTLKSGKVIDAWALEGDCDADKLKSNTFTLEWPKGSGKEKAFPEVDRAAWFDTITAKRKLNPAQAPFIDELVAKLGFPPVP
jgi:predicted NUDIX family NTP pyrophosphohydrolase